VPRALIVILLVGGAYFAARRWLECVFPLGISRGFYPEMAGFCAFGTGYPSFDQSGPGPLWPYLIVAAIYVIAAVWVMRTKRLG
jgi:hypothetical protein